MSIRGRESEHLRLVALLIAGIFLFAAPLVSLAGCGSSDSTPAAASSQEAGCHVGQSALPLISKASPWWTEGKGPTLALACLHDPVVGDAMIVGYSSPETQGGHCVNAYNVSGEWSAGEKCAASGINRWNYWCKKAQGCVWGFVHNGDITGVAGMLEATVKEIKVLVRGKPLKHGVMVAQASGKTMRSIGGDKPFGFFGVFIHGCVTPQEVKVEMLGPGGSSLGTAPGYTGPAGCPKRS
jgi:hypothetical protein